MQIFNDYKDRADFLTVYVREAHPTDEWQMKSNVKEDVCYVQPKTMEQRIAIANDFVKRYNYPIPFGIDDMSNTVNDLYAAWPENTAKQNILRRNPPPKTKYNKLNLESLQTFLNKNWEVAFFRRPPRG